MSRLGAGLRVVCVALGVALLTSGCTLWGWGYNVSGQLGDGSAVSRSTGPVQIGSVDSWKVVASGGNTTCGIRTDGSLWCWGYNFYGEVGDGSRTNRLTPTHIGNASWKAVAVGRTHTCAIQNDDTLWCWGANDTGQVGDGHVRGEVADHMPTP